MYLLLYLLVATVAKGHSEGRHTKQPKLDAGGLFHLSLHVGSTVEPQAMYTLSLGHLCSVRRIKNVSHKHAHIHYKRCRIKKTTFLTALAVGSVPPVNTDSCLSALDGVRLQAGAGVVAPIAMIEFTGLQIRYWRYMCVTRGKHARRESKHGYVSVSVSSHLPTYSTRPLKNPTRYFRPLPACSHLLISR